MKILYIEDELNSNIPRILSLFENLLGRKIRRDLEAMENDDYPPTPQEIKILVERSQLIDVEFTFSGALEKIVNHHGQYKMFIVDRNLSKEHIDELEEIQKQDPSFTEENYNIYFDREGDYLLQHLILKTKVDCLAYFYFLTAYPISDVLRDAPRIKDLIDFERFSSENFIEKGNENHYKKLRGKINEIDDFQIKQKNLATFTAIEHLGQSDVKEWLFDVFRNSENNQPKKMQQNLSTIRNIQERVFSYLRTRLDMPESFKNQWNREEKTYARGKTRKAGVISYLSEKDLFEDTDAKCANALYALCSTYGSHASSNQALTKEAHKAAIPLLQLFLLQFGKIINNLEK